MVLFFFEECVLPLLLGGAGSRCNGVLIGGQLEGLVLIFHRVGAGGGSQLLAPPPPFSFFLTMSLGV